MRASQGLRNLTRMDGNGSNSGRIRQDPLADRL